LGQNKWTFSCPARGCRRSTVAHDEFHLYDIFNNLVADGARSVTLHQLKHHLELVNDHLDARRGDDAID